MKTDYSKEHDLLNENDVKLLLMSEKKRFPPAGLSLANGVAMILVSSIFFLPAMELASELGLGFWGLVETWFSDVNTKATYSGSLVLAMEKLRSGIFFVAFGIFSLLSFWGEKQSRKHQHRIVATLRAYRAFEQKHEGQA